MSEYKLRLTGEQHRQLLQHLFPGDGKEAIAFGLCGSIKTEGIEIFCLHDIVLYPHNKCTVRTGDRVEWSPAEITGLFERCRMENLCLLKIHSHPEYWPHFSQVDDASDKYLAETIAEWTRSTNNLCSVIMLPGGELIARFVSVRHGFIPLSLITIISDDIQCFGSNLEEISSEQSNKVQLRSRQAFGQGTMTKLKSLTVGVIGCSGTGSIVAEILARLGVGKLVLIDDDVVEFKNINRILNSTTADANNGIAKVNVLKSSFDLMGTDVSTTAIAKSLFHVDGYRAAATCDIVFGCMDTIDGRNLLNRISTFFSSAYFDIGIRLDADGLGGIRDIVGRVDYLQPGKSSLLTRGRYTLDMLSTADLRRTNRGEFDRQLREGYIKNADVESPAVISINMMFSSQAVTEMLARLHPFRDRPNSTYASTSFSVGGFFHFTEKEQGYDSSLQNRVGLGDRSPRLDSPLLIIE